MDGAANSPLVFLIAGEPSGDQLAARLVQALREESKGNIRFAGVGGEQMAAEGIESLFPIDDLAVMGIVEVLPSIRLVYQRMKETLVAIRDLQPDIVVTIDSPSFSLEVSERLKKKDIPLVHYVAPSVWAWKPWRAKQMARYLDHLLALLPFEPPYFEKHGLETTFIGHPAVEAKPKKDDAKYFRARHNIPSNAKLVCLLPGSRRGEVKRLSPVFGECLDFVRSVYPDAVAVVPTVKSVAQQVRRAVQDWPVPTVVVEGNELKRQAFACADVAIAASGTVAVELAVAGLPAVITYRTNPITAWIAPYVVKVRFVSLPNLLLDRQVQPELLQKDCNGMQIATEACQLLHDADARKAQTDAYREVVQMLSPEGGTPSQKAAQVILRLLSERRPS